MKDLKTEIENFDSAKELEEYVDNLQKNDPRCEILKTGQGIAPDYSLFKHLQLKLLIKWLEEQREYITKPSLRLE